MRLFEVVVLVFGFCLVLTKAASNTDTDTGLKDIDAFVKDELDSTATKDQSSNLKQDSKETAEEDPKSKLTKEDSNQDFRKRLFIPRPLYLTISVPTNYNFRFFRVCYCFRRKCYVPGLRPGFLSWLIVYQSGYVVINNWLYFFWNCSPRPVPQPRPTRFRPRPTPTTGNFRPTPTPTTGNFRPTPTPTTGNFSSFFR